MVLENSSNPFTAQNSLMPEDLQQRYANGLDVALDRSMNTFRSASPLDTQNLSSASLIQASATDFTSGFFTVGSTGHVVVDYLFDGGGYSQGELAMFSLQGLESLGLGSPEFFQEAARRALSNSTLGHVVISDRVQGARFSGSLPWEDDFNSGDYLGGQTFAMNPGDRFGLMLVPNGTIQQVSDYPNAPGELRPLFSLGSANPNSAFQFGQIADVDGNGRTFTMEDLRLDGESDRDYNEFVIQVRGAIGSAVSLDQMIDPAKDWRKEAISQALLSYISAYDNPQTTQTTDYRFPQVNQPLIGIIDTGFAANNPDIDYSRLILGRDYVDGDANPFLAPGGGNEHGTHILGIIGATQNNGIGIDGINDQAPIWLGRAIGSGQWADSLVAFVNQALKSNQPHAIVNLSLDLTQINPDGTVTTRYEFTPQERAALEYARQSGVLIVAAAGNNGGVMSVLGQASQEFDNIITVGAADGFSRADYSSYGEGLGILAEGNDALSTVGDGIGTLTGTSVATAKVTGAISQIWAANPGLSYRQVIEIIKSTAADLNTPGWDKETGAGLLNLEAAINLAKVTEPQAYSPAAFNTPTTWSGADLVTPTERAVNQQNVDTLTGTQVFSGALTTTNTEDTYQFSINTPSSFKLNLSGFSSLINAQLFKDNSLVTAGASSLEYALLQPGNYTVKLQSAVPGAGTNYTLNLVAQNLVQDLGTITSSRAINDAVSNSTPYRYYQFTLANNSIFTSTFSGSPSTSYAKLLDSNYRPIGGSNPGTLNAGTYYIEVASLGGVSTNYSLNLQATPTTRWDNAGNYREAALNVGNLSGNKTFSDFLDNTDTTDFYRFELSTNSVFNLDLSSLGDSVSAVLYDAQGNFVASGNNRTSSQSLINRTLNTGTYYVQLYRDLVNSSLSYNLNLSATSLAPADNAGNSPALARNIGDLYPNQPQSFSDAIGDSDPVDYYRLNLPARGDLQLQLNGLNASADLRVLKLEANGATVDYGGINGQNQSQATVTLNDLPVGTYLVKVSPSAPGSNTNYTLNLATTATNVAPSNLQINLSGIYSSNQDLYVTGRVYDPNGGSDLDKVWLQFNGRDYYITNFTPSAQGTQWVEFSYNLGRVVPGTYGWAARAVDKSGGVSGLTLSNNSVQVVNAPVDTAGETPQTARDLGTVNQPISVGEFVGAVDRADVYKFTVPPTASGNGLSTLSFQLSGLSGDADFSVYQILGNGAKVSVNSPTYGTGTKTFTDQFLPGTYFVEVYTRDGSVNTNYNLRITPPTVGTLQFGQTLSGILATTDSRDPNRSTFYDDYTLAGFTPGQWVRVVVNSSGFIPQLFLLEATTGQLTAQSTVITNGNSTELEFTVPTDWNNRIRVTSREQNATGSYTLSTAPTSTGGSSGGNSLYPTINLGKLTGSQTVSNSVGGSGAINIDYRFDLDTQSSFNLNLNGLSQDASVSLGRVTQNSDGTTTFTLIDASDNPGTLAEIINQRLAPGTYAVRIGSPDNGASTNFNLTLTAGAATSSTINGYQISGNFYPVYWDNRSTLGNPIENIQTYSSTVSYQRFEGGSIVSTPTGTFILYGDTRQKYLTTGGLGGWLGLPTSDPVDQGNGTLKQTFQNGYIYWNGVIATVILTGNGNPVTQSPLTPAPIPNPVTGMPNFNQPAYQQNNPFWNVGYAPKSIDPPTPKLGNALGNCTWYANGRLRELGYSTADLDKLTGNAYQWDNQALAAGISISNTPQVGSIAQWESGHVAVVEKVNPDGTIVISESSYSPTSGTSYDFLYKTRTISASDPTRFINVPRLIGSGVATGDNQNPNPNPGQTPNPNPNPILNTSKSLQFTLDDTSLWGSGQQGFNLGGDWRFDNVGTKQPFGVGDFWVNMKGGVGAYLSSGTADISLPGLFNFSYDQSLSKFTVSPSIENGNTLFSSYLGAGLGIDFELGAGIGISGDIPFIGGTGFNFKSGFELDGADVLLGSIAPALAKFIDVDTGLNIVDQQLENNKLEGEDTLGLKMDLTEPFLGDIKFGSSKASELIGLELGVYANQKSTFSITGFRFDENNDNVPDFEVSLGKTVTDILSNGLNNLRVQPVTSLITTFAPKLTGTASVSFQRAIDSVIPENTPQWIKELVKVNPSGFNFDLNYTFSPGYSIQEFDPFKVANYWIALA